jgi:serine/threonine-protein phosphatase 2B regulatory subunit
VYDTDANGKVTASDILQVLRDLSGSFLSDKQRELVLNQALEQAGYTKDSALTTEDFSKVLGNLKMEVEVPVD